VGYLYYTNTQLALDTAAKSMEQQSQDISESVGTMMASVARIVDANATLVATDPEGPRQVEGLHFMYKQIEKLPQVYAVYMGYESDGSFYEVIHLPPNTGKFGVRNQPPPPSSHYALRVVDSKSGDRTDKYSYLSSWGVSVGEEAASSTFDPRDRPWYKTAIDKDEVAISDVFMFNSGGGAGVTLSKEVLFAPGRRIGVYAANITLDSLATFLDRKKVGHNGRVFLLDDRNRLIARSKPPGKAVIQSSAELIRGDAADDPVLAAAVARRLSGAGNRFDYELGGGERYMASFLPFIPAPGTHWVIGVIAEDEEFTSEITVATLKILAVGTLVLAVALISIHFLSGQLTRPLRRIAAEAGRIRDFQLDGEFSLASRVIEVADLAETMSSMKSSLRNFGAYVPKELVRAIVSTGRQVTVGGESRRVTIMFSDIQSFTNRSEKLEPEVVLRELSVYFQALSVAIHKNKGTIDKFIGDAVMALWNAPESDPDHVANACRAMLACQRACEQLNADHPDALLMPMVTRFGLHCGDAMVGNVGAQDRLQYSVLGATVNLASRIEGLNKAYGTRLLVSDAVVAVAGDSFVFRPVDLAAPAGTTRPIGLFELMGEGGDDAARQRQTAWQAGYQLYQDRQWAEAAAAFLAYLDRYGEEKLARLYVERCQHFVADPPPADWNGVRSFDHK
ncbi:MAG TPA: adenylate/guanylate cyclase domain-containing protein, partial [Rhodospirillaceae bacterium]|nr:adenylate/guanylate cyclase domain-containing protein [Rhodospirillaceae bacterium]